MLWLKLPSIVSDRPPALRSFLPPVPARVFHWGLVGRYKLVGATPL